VNTLCSCDRILSGGRFYSEAAVTCAASVSFVIFL